MVIPDLPKEIYLRMKSMCEDRELSQWHVIMLGLWALEYVGAHDEYHRDLKEATDLLLSKYPKPAEQTYKPRWKGKRIS